MAATYAACVSLSHIIHQILHPPPAHHFQIPRELIESLQEQVSSFIFLLETNPSHEIEGLEKRIVAAAHRAEDIIETYVVTQIQAKYKTHPERKSSAPFLRSIQKEIRAVLPIQLKKKAIVEVIDEFVSIREEIENKKELEEIENKKEVEEVRPEKSHRNWRNMFFKRKEEGLSLEEQISSSTQTKVFTAQELAEATNQYNENRIISRGSRSTVYKGELADGRVVAIKKNWGEEDQQGLINEVVILSQAKHRNVVQLLGFCLETEARLLVYEFINNGTLHQHIHEHDDHSEYNPLPWEIRVRIAREAAEGLAYLHSGISPPIYHGDIKSSNILLDHKYQPIISDFELSRTPDIDKTHVTTIIHGTRGYLDPEYFQSSQYTEKSDVYSFGVVLAELLTGEKAIRSYGYEFRNLAEYFLRSMEKEQLFEILDARVLKEGRAEDIMAMAGIAERCLQWEGRHRPTMKEVAVELEGIHIVKEQIMRGFNDDDSCWCRNRLNQKGVQMQAQVHDGGSPSVDKLLLGRQSIVRVASSCRRAHYPEPASSRLT